MAMITPTLPGNPWDDDVYRRLPDIWMDMTVAKEEFVRNSQVFQQLRLTPSEYNAAMQPMTDKRVLLCV